MATDADVRIAARAANQFGLITRAQALAAGLTARQIENRLTTGRWTLARPSLYRIAGTPVTWHAKVFEPCLAFGARASHRSAGVLWGLDDFRRGRPDVTVRRGTRVHWDGIRVHESTQFDRRLGTVWLAGIPVTGIDRTLIDNAGLLSFDRLLIAIDECRRRRLTTWPNLFETLVRHSVQGRDGAGGLRAVLEEKYGEPVVPDSAFERMVERLLLDAGLPQPELQHEVYDERDSFVARIDLAYPPFRVGIELDGRRHIEDAAFERDPERRNRLVGLGWTMYQYTWRAYVDHPARLCAEIRRAVTGSGDT